MIDFRYHLVSLIAVLFALAAGVILGAGPLKDDVDQALTSQLSELRDTNQTLRDQITTLQGSGAYSEDYDSRVEGPLTAGQLQDQDVVVVALPGANGDLVGEARDALRAAGATVTGTLQLNDKWFEAEAEEDLDALAQRSIGNGSTVPGETGYDKSAAVLAGALVTKPAEPDAPETDPPTLTLLRDADYIDVDGELSPRAGLAVVVSGPAPTGDSAEAQTAALMPIAAALDAASQGTLVAGPPAAAEPGGVIAAIRGDGDDSQLISTVDVLNSSAGRVAAVFALVEQLQGGAGHYGTVGRTDGPLPADFAATIARPTAAPSPSPTPQ